MDREVFLTGLKNKRRNKEAIRRGILCISIIECSGAVERSVRVPCPSTVPQKPSDSNVRNGLRSTRREMLACWWAIISDWISGELVK